MMSDNIKVMTNDSKSIEDYLNSIERAQIKNQSFKDLFKAFILPFTINCQTYTYHSIIDEQEPNTHSFFINFAKSLVYVNEYNKTPIDQFAFNKYLQIQTTDEVLLNYYFMPSNVNTGQRNWALETNRPFSYNKVITYVKRNILQDGENPPTIQIPYFKMKFMNISIPLLTRNKQPFFQPDGITPLYLDDIKDGDGNPLQIPYVTKQVVESVEKWIPALDAAHSPYMYNGDIATITVPMDPYYTKYLKYKQKYQELKNKLNKN
jgi:hypothetical protein